MSSYTVTIVATVADNDLTEHTANLEVTDQDTFDEEADEFTNRVEMYTDLIHVDYRITRVGNHVPEEASEFIARFIKGGVLSPEFWQWQEAMSSSPYTDEVWEAAQALGIAPDEVVEAYQGAYQSDEDFAQELAEQLGLMPEDLSWPMGHIDWSGAARDLMMDYAEENGQYFRNM